MLSIIGGVIRFVLEIALYAYSLIVWLIMLMSKPFKKLAEAWKRLVDRKLPALSLLDSKFAYFNGLRPFLLFAAALIFSVVTIWINVSNEGAGENYLESIIYNTTLGSFIGFLNNGLDFTPATFVAIAFSGTLLSICMSSHDPEGDVAPIYVRFPCYVVYLAATAIVATMLTGIFESVGQWGYQMIVDLFNRKGGSFFAIAGKIIALIPLGYVALLLCMITVRTYAESFLFGLLGMIAFIIVGFLLTLIPEGYTVLNTILTIVFMGAFFFGLDMLQSHAIGKMEAWMKEEMS